MLELWNESISSANIIYTMFLGVAIIYALFVVIGFLDMDAFDVDFDIDADIDVDVDVDTDIDTDVQSSGGFMIQVLSFFNLGKIPFMIIYSFTTVFMWAIGMIVNHRLGNGDITFTLATFIPVMLLSLLITKFLTKPLIPAFKSLHESTEATDYIGMKGILLLPIQKGQKSQVEVRVNGDVHKILVSLRKDDTNHIPKGKEVFITGVSEDKSFYWIEKDDLI